MKSLLQENSVAVITGAGQGIGLAASRDLAEKGVSVCMVDLPEEALDEAADQIAGAQAFAADPSKADSIHSLCSEILEKFGTINVLFNNAVTRARRGFGAPPDEWRLAMDVNFWAVVEATRLLLPSMLESTGRGLIINAGSKQGITNPPGHPIYNITKSTLKTYTEALEHDLRNREENTGPGRVSAHLLIPGWTEPAGDDHPDGAWFPDQVSAFMWDSVEQGDFYILCPDNEVTTDMDHRRIRWGLRTLSRTAHRSPVDTRASRRGQARRALEPRMLGHVWVEPSNRCASDTGSKEVSS